ncbi:CIC11C00000002398 [Sungouiella intermedia]|uniref:CIC11C00000002398 n=1 Tax=Sungouiella intermedia TaxID=45354 RepID=A0A1L0DAL8_9ASCO|nr:CIC11C00000002398 [[Candida] intermedia]
MTKEVTANADAGTIRIFVVRHGRTDFNAQKIMQGHLDIDINDEGKVQAQKVGHYLKDIHFDNYITSDLIRCVNTSAPILEHQQVKDVITTSNLRERNMGPVQGMRIQDAIDQYGPDFRNLGEKEHELLARVESVWNQIFKKAVTENHMNVCVCTHGGVITGFINHLYDSRDYQLAEGLLKTDLKVPFNTSVAVIDLDKKTGAGTIQKFGVTEHLGGHFEVKNQLLR